MEDENVMDRHIRAPFNGMRGKRYPSDNEEGLSNFNRWTMKRAPFNGMRGKRVMEEQGFNPQEDEQLNYWSEMLAKRARGVGAGFVGMRGR